MFALHKEWIFILASRKVKVNFRKTCTLSKYNKLYTEAFLEAKPRKKIAFLPTFA